MLLKALNLVHSDRDLLISLNDDPAAVSVQIVDVDALQRENVHNAGEILHSTRAI